MTVLSGSSATGVNWRGVCWAQDDVSRLSAMRWQNSSQNEIEDALASYQLLFGEVAAIELLPN